MTELEQSSRKLCRMLADERYRSSLRELATFYELARCAVESAAPEELAVLKDTIPGYLRSMRQLALAGRAHCAARLDNTRRVRRYHGRTDRRSTRSFTA